MHATRDQIPLLFGTDRAGIRGTDWGELPGLRSPRSRLAQTSRPS